MEPGMLCVFYISTVKIWDIAIYFPVRRALQKMGKLPAPGCCGQAGASRIWYWFLPFYRLSEVHFIPPRTDISFTIHPFLCNPSCFFSLIIQQNN